MEIIPDILSHLHPCTFSYILKLSLNVDPSILRSGSGLTGFWKVTTHLVSHVCMNCMLVLTILSA